MSALTDAGYLRYFVGTCFSFAGNTAHMLSAAVAVIAMGGSPALVPLMLLLSVATTAACSLAVPHWLGHVDPRRVLMAVDAASATIVFALCIVLHVHPHVGCIVVAEVALAAFGAAHYTATRAFIRRLLPAERLLSGNAMLGVAFQIGNLAGAGIGSLLLGKVGIVATFAFNALTFATSFALLSRTPLRMRGDGEIPRGVSERGALGQALEAFRANPTAAPLVAIMLSFLLLQRALVSLGPGIVAGDMGHSPSAFGVLLVAFACGSLLGGLLLPRLARWPRARDLVHVLYPATALFLVLFPVTGWLPFGAVALAVAGFCYQGWTVYQTMLQERLDPSSEGRVFSIAGGLQSVTLAAMFGIGTVSAHLFGARNGFWITTGLVATCTLPFVAVAARSHFLNREETDEVSLGPYIE